MLKGCVHLLWLLHFSQIQNMGTILSKMLTVFKKIRRVEMRAELKTLKKTQKHKPRGRGSERNKREEQENRENKLTSFSCVTAMLISLI